MMKKCLMSVAAIAAICPVVNAQITWIDNVLTGPDANTTLADGTAMNLVIENDRTNPQDFYLSGTNTVNAQSDANNNAAFWGVRDVFGTNSTPTILQTSVLVAPEARGGASQSTSEDVPILKTTLTGLIEGATYNLFGYYYSQNQGVGNDGQSWDARFSLDGINFTTFDDLNLDANTTLGTFEDGFAPPVTSVNSDSILLTQANLGTGVAIGGQIEIFFDDGLDPQRTWYEGVGYQIVPEPSSCMLLLSAIGLSALRRRRS